MPGDLAKRLPLDTRQFAVNSPRGPFPIFRKSNDEGTAIVRVRFASDPSTTDKTIEDARKSRPAVRQGPMEFSYGGVTGSGEVRKDVSLALGDAETIEKNTYAVGGAMNLRNKTQRHSESFPEQYAVAVRSSQDFTRKRMDQGSGYVIPYGIVRYRIT